MKNSIKTKDGYFNLEGWFEKIQIDYTKDKKVTIITSPRNNGKTFASWNFINEKIWKHFNYEWKVAICRTNDLKMKQAISSFKAAFNGVYEVINEYIYKCEYDDKNKLIQKNKKVIGRFINVENEHNYRSAADGGFKDFHFFFWDEFNETKQQSLDLYTKFMMLLSTVERFNKPFIVLLLGNKINANNDIFIKLNLNVSNRDLKKDYIQKVSDSIYYIDVGFDTYDDLGNKNTLVNQMSKFDKKTDRLFNQGGFLEGTYYNVLNSMNFKNRKIKYYFQLGYNLVEYGLCKVNNVETFYISECDEIKENKNVISLDVVGYSLNGHRISSNDLIQVANILFTHIQNKEIFFSSFFIMNEIEKWVYRNTDLFKVE